MSEGGLDAAGGFELARLTLGAPAEGAALAEERAAGATEVLETDLSFMAGKKWLHPRGRTPAAAS